MACFVAPPRFVCGTTSNPTINLQGTSKMHRKHILGLAVAAAALASIGVFAQQGGLSKDDIIEAVSPDIPSGKSQQRLALKASDTTAAAVAARAAAPTVEDVYDVDSFKRDVVFLGLTSTFINLSDTCPTDPENPDELCQVLSPAPAFTSFNFQDAARIKLPPRSANSLLCYWFSPLLTVNYANFGATPALGRFRYSPTLTIENPVLDDPALIDPTTGVPFGGKLLTSMSSSESFQVPLDPGTSFTERTRDSTVCMAGFVSKRALIDNYGLTEAQAKEFFRKSTTVRLNVSGQVQNVGFASMVFGLRIVGDER
jgi:hypothetical protein